LSPDFAVTVTVTTTSNSASLSRCVAFWSCTSTCGWAGSRNTCGLFGVSTEASLT
jgi:hypothetical protein